MMNSFWALTMINHFWNLHTNHMIITYLHIAITEVLPIHSLTANTEINSESYDSRFVRSLPPDLTENPNGRSTFQGSVSSKSRRQAGSHDSLFQCEECGKAFSKRFKLKKHRLLHVGKAERPFRCNVCGANFTQNRGLIRHLRTHNTEKTLKCELIINNDNNINNNNAYIYNTP